MYRRTLFDRFAKAISSFAGHPVAFATAAGIIVLWIVSGPVFRFSDTWQLVINTATTIVTFLMVFQGNRRILGSFIRARATCPGRLRVFQLGDLRATTAGGRSSVARLIPVSSLAAIATVVFLFLAGEITAA